jgi:hypothetical protein
MEAADRHRDRERTDTCGDPLEDPLAFDSAPGAERRRTGSGEIRGAGAMLLPQQIGAGPDFPVVDHRGRIIDAVPSVARAALIAAGLVRAL